MYLLYLDESGNENNPRLVRHFYWEDGVIHGLVHVGPSRGRNCDCPACSSRRIRGSLGAWIPQETSP